MNPGEVYKKEHLGDLLQTLVPGLDFFKNPLQHVGLQRSVRGSE